MPPLAEPGKRILARLIDFLIISIPLYLISLPWGGAVEVTDNNGNSGDLGDVFSQTYSGHQLIWSLIGLVVYVAYDTYFTHKDGRTIGKRLLKLRVAMLNDGRVPDTGASFLRAVVLWLAGAAVLPVPVVADQHRAHVHGQAVPAGPAGQGREDGGRPDQLTPSRGPGPVPRLRWFSGARSRRPTGSSAGHGATSRGADAGARSPSRARPSASTAAETAS